MFTAALFRKSVKFQDFQFKMVVNIWIKLVCWLMILVMMIQPLHLSVVSGNIDCCLWVVSTQCTAILCTSGHWVYHYHSGKHGWSGLCKLHMEALQASATISVSQRWTNFCSMVEKKFWINFDTQLTLRHTAFIIFKKYVVCNHSFSFRQLLVPKITKCWPF